MTNPELQAQIEGARAYQALFVPALLGQWAPKVADAANLATGQSVLDVACGTGVLTREVRRRTGPDVYVAGLDLNPGMIAVAKELCPTEDMRVGNAESMPFSGETFDAVVSQFGLMFMDRDKAPGEMLRVLAPGGRLAVAVWDSVQNIPAYAAEEALIERCAGPRAAEPLRAPFALGDREVLAEIFNKAGARSVNIETLKGVARFPSIRVMVEADLRGWLPLMGVTLTEQEIATILQEAEEVLDQYVTDDGRVTFDTLVHIVTARKS